MQRRMYRWIEENWFLMFRWAHSSLSVDRMAFSAIVPLSLISLTSTRKSRQSSHSFSEYTFSSCEKSHAALNDVRSNGAKMNDECILYSAPFPLIVENGFCFHHHFPIERRRNAVTVNRPVAIANHHWWRAQIVSDSNYNYCVLCSFLSGTNHIDCSSETLLNECWMRAFSMCCCSCLRSWWT